MYLHIINGFCAYKLLHSKCRVINSKITLHFGKVWKIAISTLFPLLAAMHMFKYNMVFVLDIHLIHIGDIQVRTP